jgi:hypothetical protein
MRFVRRLTVAAPVCLGLMGIVGLTGCQDFGTPHIDRAPLNREQDVLASQRNLAHRFDPFPDPDAGPSVREVRPRDFAVPPPEPSRSRWTLQGQQP